MAITPNAKPKLKRRKLNREAALLLSIHEMIQRHGGEYVAKGYLDQEFLGEDERLQDLIEEGLVESKDEDGIGCGTEEISLTATGEACALVLDEWAEPIRKLASSDPRRA